jgi:hypothetical protein
LLALVHWHTVVFNSATNEIEHTLSAYGVDTDVDNLGESFFASADYTSIKKFALSPFKNLNYRQKVRYLQ